LRGVGRRARRPKSPFGSGLERLSYVRMSYFQRENAELVSLTGCELIDSQFALQSDYARSVALDYFTEVAEQLLPAHEPNEKFFRLMIAVLAFLRSGGEVWPAVAYFSLWAVRLTGILPDLRLGRESGEIAREMIEQPLSNLAPRTWSKATASDLRRVLIRTMEQHVERKFLTVPLLESL
jgi:DNA repair protein RecO (recombination protein O)